MKNDIVRHKENPFLENLEIKLASKNVRITPLGNNDNILINQSSGEVSGTHVVAHKRVDSSKFVKTFADYMAFTFDLTKAGNKALKVVMWAVQQKSINKDTVSLTKYTLEDFLLFHELVDPPLSLSQPTFARGLKELEEAKIIAKTRERGLYFINPNCIFNGDRIAFTTVIERDK